MIHLTQPWALLALLAIPVLIALYALRPRRRRVVLSTTSIWREALAERQRGMGLQKLLRDLSLLALLLFAALLAVALGDPRLLTRASERSDVIVVLDTSASMHAQDAGVLGRRTRFDRAAAKAHDIIESLPDDARALIMTSGRTPRLHTGFESDREQLLLVLNQIEAGDEAGRPREALELALSLLKNRRNAKIHFIAAHRY